jgi:uncharacterized protein
MTPETTRSPRQDSFMRRLVLAALIVSIIGALLAAVLTSGRDPLVLLNIFTIRFLGIFIEAAPFLLLGAFASGLIDAFVRPDDIARLMPRNPVLATFAGAGLGFFFPVCECGVIPVVRRLYAKGLPMSVGIAFLLAAPVINPIVLVATYVAYGFGPVLIGRFVLTFIVAVAVGLVFMAAARPRDILRPTTLSRMALAAPRGGMEGATTADLAAAVRTQMPRRSLKDGLRTAVFTAIDDFFDMGRYLVIGTVLAATMQTFVPQETLTQLGSGPVVSVLVLQLVAFVLSVCSTVDAFLSLAFVNTFTPGAIIAFLTFGPMVDIKALLMYSGVFRMRVVLYLFLLPLLLVMLASIWINLNIPL